MAVLVSRVTVSTIPVASNVSDSSGTRLLLKNIDATNAVDLGPSTVSAGAGFPLTAGVSMEIDVDAGEVVYAIRSASADVVVAVLRS